MNRFPPHYHERAEQPLRCFQCDSRLTDYECDNYWASHPYGEREPRCFDCLSQLEVDDLKITRTKQPRHMLSGILFGSAIGFVVLAALGDGPTGLCVMAMLICLNLGILARVSKW